MALMSACTPESAEAGAPSLDTGSSMEVTVQTVSPQPIRGLLVSLSSLDGLAILVDGALQRVAAEDLVRITTTVQPVSRINRDSTVTLSGMDMIHGRITDGEADALTVESRDLGVVSVSLDAVAGIDTPQSKTPAYRQAVEWLDRGARADQDRVLLTNGDVLSGFITAIDGDGLVVEGLLGETRVNRSLIVAVRLVPPQSKAAEEIRFALTLRDSGRITVTRLDWCNRVVQAQMRQGPGVRIEAERVVAVEIDGGRWQWLCDSQPISHEHTPMLSLDWNYRVNRNVLGGPIKIAGEEFIHGIGVHSRSSLTYDLKGAFGQLVTHFGIDDNSGPYADVTVHILVDGQPRYTKKNVCRGELHGPVRLDVSRADRIELVTEFGENGDLQDRFDWVDTALIR